MDQSTASEQKPPIQPAPTGKARRRWPIYVVAAFFVVLILGGVGFVGASALEDHDSFCIACHTVPETTYYNRAYLSLDNPADAPVDLATAHYHLYQKDNKGSFTCIDCHRGDASLTQRVEAITLGGRDALIYVVGREDPQIEKTDLKEGWLANDACISCHTDTLLTLNGLDSHFHNHLPAAAQALANGGKLIIPDKQKQYSDVLLKRGLDPVANISITCTDCHLAHQTTGNGGEQTMFIQTERRNQACIECHVAVKQGPQSIQELQQE